MKDIGIRQLKARASELVRKVSEDRVIYAITRHGRTVGVLAPSDFVISSEESQGYPACERLLMFADKLECAHKRRKSGVLDLKRTRR